MVFYVIHTFTLRTGEPLCLQVSGAFTEWDRRVAALATRNFDRILSFVMMLVIVKTSNAFYATCRIGRLSRRSAT
jgi:hypothetical protein